MKLKWKVCGMRDLQNIRDVLELKPDYMGLIFYAKSPRCVSRTDKEYTTLFRQIDFGQTQKVGVFVNDSMGAILKTVQDFALDIVQLHGDETPNFYKELKANHQVKIIKVTRVNHAIPWEAIHPYVDYADYLLFDTNSKAYGGSGKTFDHQLLRHNPFQKPFFLSGGMGPSTLKNIQESISHSEVYPWLHAVDLNSRFEHSPALKNVAFIKKTIAEL